MRGYSSITVLILNNITIELCNNAALYGVDIAVQEYNKKQQENSQNISPSLSLPVLIITIAMLSMLTPLSIDMYLPSFLAIANDFNVTNTQVQLTLSSYVAGFALGQLFYGPISDSTGRKPVILAGLAIFIFAAIGCALSQSINQLVLCRLIHGLAAASAAVVINALMRDLFRKEDFSRMMSFVTLIMTIAPLLAPIIGGWIIHWFNWQATFWILVICAVILLVMVFVFIPETLKKADRQQFRISTTARNFLLLFKHRQVMCYIMSGAFSFAGLFSFLSAGPFVYMQLNNVAEDHFGYYFAVNIIFMFIMTTINSRNVRHKGAIKMFHFGLTIQFTMGLCLLLVNLFQLPFIFMVISVAGYVGCVSMISSNAMAIILEDFPFMAGTAASLVGTLRFGTGGIVGFLLSMIPTYSAWPMVGSMVVCVTISTLFAYWTINKRQINNVKK